ncbi:MAG: hypothetical protein GY909_13315 [Oligoflexia bacterium]|nr:hypothetical protein [Oligoflexia bacterium]
MSIEGKLLEGLLTNFKNGQAAPFYIARAKSQDQIKEWEYTLISKFFNSNFDSLIENGHPDLLFITKGEKEKNYTVDDPSLEEFFRLLPYGPTKSTHRFFIIHEGHKLTERLLNKLLKTLEEPPKNTTIIINLPSEYKILETITSRAITITLPTHGNYQALEKLSDKKQFKEMLADKLEANGHSFKDSFKFLAGELGTQEYINSLKKKREEIPLVLSSIIDTLNESDANHQNQQLLLDEIQKVEEALIYHSFSNSGMYRLLTQLIV